MPSFLPSFLTSFRQGFFAGPVAKGGDPFALVMPVPAERCHTTALACLVPPAPINTHQPGVATSLLYSGSQFRGYQKSKGNAYEVEVAVQVNFQPRACPRLACLLTLNAHEQKFKFIPSQWTANFHVLTLKLKSLNSKIDFFSLRTTCF